MTNKTLFGRYTAMYSFLNGVQSRILVLFCEECLQHIKYFRGEDIRAGKKKGLWSDLHL